MAKVKIPLKRKSFSQAMVQVPLAALRCISRYPKEKKIICEIRVDKIKRFNSAETLDEIINEARLDYAVGKYKTFSSARALLNELHS